MSSVQLVTSSVSAFAKLANSRSHFRRPEVIHDALTMANQGFTTEYILAEAGGSAGGSTTAICFGRSLASAWLLSCSAAMVLWRIALMWRPF